MCVTEPVLVQEWRLVVRRDAVGDPDIRPRASIRGAVWRAGAWQLHPVLRRASAGRGPRTAGQLPSRDLRPHGRVLEPRRAAQTHVPRDPYVPAEEEHGLLAVRRVAATRRRWFHTLISSVLYSNHASIVVDLFKQAPPTSIQSSDVFRILWRCGGGSLWGMWRGCSPSH